LRTSIVITDVTRMRRPNVCIAGYTGYPSFLECVRPVFLSGPIHENRLYYRGTAVIRPFAQVELEFLEKAHEIPPHTEDYMIDSAVLPSGNALLSREERLTLLQTLDDECVEKIFGATLQRDHGFYVKSGEGSRSLGTIRPKQVYNVFCGESPSGRPDYRIRFSNGQHLYRLKVTDLTFQYYVDRQKQVKPSEQVSEEVSAVLRSAGSVFFRIGLARGWDKYPDRCYLQITGIYTFPDYLDGKCFADFA